MSFYLANEGTSLSTDFLFPELNGRLPRDEIETFFQQVLSAPFLTPINNFFIKASYILLNLNDLERYLLTLENRKIISPQDKFKKLFLQAILLKNMNQAKEYLRLGQIDPNKLVLELMDDENPNIPALSVLVSTGVHLKKENVTVPILLFLIQVLEVKVASITIDQTPLKEFAFKSKNKKFIELVLKHHGLLLSDLWADNSFKQYVADQLKIPINNLKYVSFLNELKQLGYSFKDLEVQKDLFFKALKSDDLEIVQFIYNEGFKIEDITKNRDIILYFLFLPHSSNAVRIFEFLLKRGAPPNNSNADGETPLHIVIRRNYWGFFKLLLQYEANLFAVDKKKVMVLHLLKPTDEVLKIFFGKSEIWKAFEKSKEKNFVTFITLNYAKLERKLYGEAIEFCFLFPNIMHSSRFAFSNNQYIDALIQLQKKYKHAPRAFLLNCLIKEKIDLFKKQDTINERILTLSDYNNKFFDKKIEDAVISRIEKNNYKLIALVAYTHEFFADYENKIDISKWFKANAPQDYFYTQLPIELRWGIECLKLFYKNEEKLKMEIHKFLIINKIFKLDFVMHNERAFHEDAFMASITEGNSSKISMKGVVFFLINRNFVEELSPGLIDTFFYRSDQENPKRKPEEISPANHKHLKLDNVCKP